jgi:hypothetical protein
MEHEVSYCLVAVNPSIVSSIIVIPGDVTGRVVGRKELGDTRVSRQCVLLVVSPTNELKIQRLSHSPVFLTRGNSDCVALNADRAYILRVGDIVSFGPRQHHYKVVSGGHDVPTIETPQMRDDRRSVIRSVTSFDCTLCLSDAVPVEATQRLRCGHGSCRDCLTDYCLHSLEERHLPITCPARDCGVELSERELETVMDPSQMERYRTHLLALFLERNGNAFSCCPTPNCEYMFHFGQGDRDFLCPQCHRHYCLSCKAPYHARQTCAEYQQSKTEANFEALALDNKWKQCGGCKGWVERKSGCNHIRCRCGAQFCYVCGESWVVGKCLPYQCRSRVATPPRTTTQPRRFHFDFSIPGESSPITINLTGL